MATTATGKTNIPFNLTVHNDGIDIGESSITYSPDRQTIIAQAAAYDMCVRRAVIPSSGAPILDDNDFEPNSYQVGFIAPLSGKSYMRYVPSLADFRLQTRVTVRTFLWCTTNKIFVCDEPGGEWSTLAPTLIIDLTTFATWQPNWELRDIVYNSTRREYYLLIWKMVLPYTPTNALQVMPPKNMEIYVVDEEFTPGSFRMYFDISGSIGAPWSATQSSVFNMVLTPDESDDGSTYRYLLLSRVLFDSAQPYNASTALEVYAVQIDLTSLFPVHAWLVYTLPTYVVGSTFVNRLKLSIAQGTGSTTNPDLVTRYPRTYTLTVDFTNAWFPDTYSTNTRLGGYYSYVVTGIPPDFGTLPAVLTTSVINIGFTDPAAPNLQAAALVAINANADQAYLAGWAKIGWAVGNALQTTMKSAAFACPTTNVVGWYVYQGSFGSAGFPVTPSVLLPVVGYETLLEPISLVVGYASADAAGPDLLNQRALELRAPPGQTMHRCYTNSYRDLTYGNWLCGGMGPAGFDSPFFAYSPDGVRTTVIMCFHTDMSGERTTVIGTRPQQAAPYYALYKIDDIENDYPGSGGNPVLYLSGTGARVPGEYNLTPFYVGSAPIRMFTSAAREVTGASAFTSSSATSLAPYLFAINSTILEAWLSIPTTDMHFVPTTANCPVITFDTPSRLFSLWFPAAFETGFDASNGMVMNYRLWELFQFLSNGTAGISVSGHLNRVRRLKSMSRAPTHRTPEATSIVARLSHLGALFRRIDGSQSTARYVGEPDEPFEIGPIMSLPSTKRVGAGHPSLIIILAGPSRFRGDITVLDSGDFLVRQAFLTLYAWTHVIQYGIVFNPPIFYSEQMNLGADGAIQRASLLTTVVPPADLLPGDDLQYQPSSGLRWKLMYSAAINDTFTVTAVGIGKHGQVIPLPLFPGHTFNVVLEFVPQSLVTFV